MASKPLRETGNARRAYADYEAMGPDRSLAKLHAEYIRRKDGGEAVPTVTRRNLDTWSAKHGWQARLVAYEEQETEERRRRLRARVARQDERVMVGIEVGTLKFLQAVERGEVALVDGVADLVAATKLYRQVAGEPLAEKLTQEHTGPGGGPMQVQTIPLPIFGPQDPLNHFGEDLQVEPDDDAAEE